MRRGKIVRVEGLRATLEKTLGFSPEDDGYIRTSPFGFIAKPTPNTFAYFNNLNGDYLAPIIIGWQHQKRPEPTDIGGSVVYSTDDKGLAVKAFLELFKDGKINFKSLDKGSIEMLPDGTITFDTTDGSLIQLKPDGKILLGSPGSAEPLVLGTAFTTLYNAHTHVGNLGAPTGPPMVPMAATEISSKSFTEI